LKRRQRCPSWSRTDLTSTEQTKGKMQQGCSTILQKGGGWGVLKGGRPREKLNEPPDGSPEDSTEWFRALKKTMTVR